MTGSRYPRVVQAANVQYDRPSAVFTWIQPMQPELSQKQHKPTAIDKKDQGIDKHKMFSRERSTDSGSRARPMSRKCRVTKGPHRQAQSPSLTQSVATQRCTVCRRCRAVSLAYTQRLWLRLVTDGGDAGQIKR